MSGVVAETKVAPSLPRNSLQTPSHSAALYSLSLFLLLRDDGVKPQVCEMWLAACWLAGFLSQSPTTPPPPPSAPAVTCLT